MPSSIVDPLHEFRQPIDRHELAILRFPDGFYWSLLSSRPHARPIVPFIDDQTEFSCAEVYLRIEFSSWERFFE
jgi:hypothetical protein